MTIQEVIDLPFTCSDCILSRAMVLDEYDELYKYTVKEVCAKKL